jgi:hypothetical protein
MSLPTTLSLSVSLGLAEALSDVMLSSKEPTMRRFIAVLFAVAMPILFVYPPADATPGVGQEKTREYCIDRFPLAGDACERTRLYATEDLDSNGWTLLYFNVKAENNCQNFESSPAIETNDVFVKNNQGNYVAEALIPNIGTGNGCEHDWFTNLHIGSGNAHMCYYGFARVNNAPDENIYECWTFHAGGGITYGWDPF